MKIFPSGRRLVLALIISALLASLPPPPLEAKKRLISLEELVKEAEVIVYGRVQEQRDLGLVRREGSHYRKYKNTFVPEKVLKGDWPKGKPMTFITYKFHHRGKPAWQEDELVFPLPGCLALIFATRKEKDGFAPVNGLNGLWPFDAQGRGYQLGLGITLPEVEARIQELLTRP